MQWRFPRLILTTQNQLLLKLDVIPKFFAINGDNQILTNLQPTFTTALVKSNNMPVIMCCEVGPEQPYRIRKILFDHSELNMFMSSLVADMQASSARSCPC
ncbi:unnamed protein product [Leptidea sinapis]|uniref:Uncharacterized protein n=1 Tax=Leptidea sinapis TaxID=189913 RepID=A0A5E4PWR7_9NEOP|nr:unnamed protein product [Leptidea sinapis]